jgi:hypothetical protein
LPSALDLAIAAASGAEAAFEADTLNVANIQAAEATAASPLVAAQLQLNTDQGLYVASLNALSEAALAEAATFLPPPAPLAPPPPPPS